MYKPQKYFSAKQRSLQSLFYFNL